MQLKNILPLALAASVSAQSLTELLTSQNQTLSVLTGLVAGIPGLVDQLSGLENITILAPSNAALAAFTNSSAGLALASDPAGLTALLTYHVLNGTYESTAFKSDIQFLPTLLSNPTYTNVTGGQVVGGKVVGSDVVVYSGLLQTSKVTAADLTFNNGGVVHVIDKVLTIPASDSATATAANLTSLTSALTTANLVQTVDGLKDVTIFAPSNAAFASIASVAANLSATALGEILQYHVVSGTVGYSTKLSNTTIKALDKKDLNIKIIGGNVFVNSAKVITADVLVANGVVHVIDGVLNPNNTSATPNPTATVPAFPGASGAPTTSSGAPAGTTSPTPVTANAARPMQTGAMGMGALFGGAALFAAAL